MRDKRTEAEREFDWGIKGWAFTHKDFLPDLVERAENLYDKLGHQDKERKSVLKAIRRAAGE